MQEGMNELLGLPYSPWSEKARWALDVRKVPYRYRVYQPLIGELELRIKMRRLRGPVTVPLLIDERGRVYDDSTDIARFADTLGEGFATTTRWPKWCRAACARHWVGTPHASASGACAERYASIRRARARAMITGRACARCSISCVLR